MEYGVKDRNILDKFCIDFCSIIEKYVRYIIVSGFVAIASGRSRATEDIDMIMERIDKEKFTAIHKELEKKGFVCMQSDDPEEIYSYLKDNISIRYTYKDKPLPQMEVKFSKSKLDEYQLNTRQKLPLTGVDVWFSSIDMNIAFKEEYLKSEKDIEDARHLRIAYAEMINEDEINHIKSLIRRYLL